MFKFKLEFKLHLFNVTLTALLR